MAPKLKKDGDDYEMSWPALPQQLIQNLMAATIMCSCKARCLLYIFWLDQKSLERSVYGII